MKFTLLIVSILFPAYSVFAGSVPDAAGAVRAIIGEAAGESDLAMLAVAGAIRNRGTLQGVYGVSNRVITNSSSTVWARAEKAWLQSSTVRVTDCKYFGGPTDAPYFLNTLHFKPVKTIGKITFYKP